MESGRDRKERRERGDDDDDDDDEDDDDIQINSSAQVCLFTNQSLMTNTQHTVQQNSI